MGTRKLKRNTRIRSLKATYARIRSQNTIYRFTFFAYIRN
jgi:hypothetical protein